MNRFNPNELKALRKSAAALNKSDYEVTKRLEDAFDQLTLILLSMHDQSSTQLLETLGDRIDRVIEKLEDTKTITDLVLRERSLERKLAELDKENYVVPPEDFIFNTCFADKIKAGESAFEEDVASDTDADPDTLRRIRQKQQLESLIDSLYTSTQAELIKKTMQRIPATITRRLFTVSPDHRGRLEVQIATSKGEGYEPPKVPDGLGN